MKKLQFTLALLALAPWAFGQGYVNFNNTTTTKASTNSTLVTGTAPGSWYYALLVAPSTQNTIDSTLNGWTFVGLGTNTSQAGRMASSFAIDGNGSLVPGTTSTSTADFAIVAWSGNLGGNYSDIFTWRPLFLVGNGQIGHAGWPTATSGGWYGISTVANDVLLNPAGGPYNNVWGSAATSRIEGINLNFYLGIPEPSTFALAALGAAALLIYRRRA